MALPGASCGHRCMSSWYTGTARNVRGQSPRNRSQLMLDGDERINTPAPCPWSGANCRVYSMRLPGVPSGMESQLPLGPSAHWCPLQGSRASGGRCCLVTKLCPNSLQPHGLRPASFLCGISQARIVEWVAVSFPRGSYRLRDRTPVSCTGSWTLSLPR